MSRDLQTTNAVCRVLSDPSRVRILLLLAEEPLSVAELVRITGLAQSRVSTHLARLKEVELAQTVRVGSLSRYAASAERMPAQVGELWEAVARTLDDPLIAGDKERLTRVIAARHQPWAETVAGSMERHYAPGRTWESTARAFLGLAPLQDVIDIASGDGAIAQLLAPRATKLTCLDISEAIVHAGRQRFKNTDNVDFVRGDMHELPFDDSRFDQALLLNALSYTTEPARVLRECARVLRPNGVMVAVTLAAHPHRDIVATFGHENLGFEREALTGLLVEAGFEVRLLGALHEEKRSPNFKVITVHAEKRNAPT